jgi:hypothetical protein
VSDEPTDLSRSELRLIRQAVRQDWPIPPEIKRQILQRLIDYLDREHSEGQTCSDRQVVMAARTLVQFMRLSIEQQKVDLDRDKLEGKRGGFDLEAVTRMMQAKREQLKSSPRSAGGSAQ